MDAILKKELYNKLSHDKIKINWNKSPIKMDDFLGFITVDTEIIKSHLGDYTGWTRRENKDIRLVVMGGILNGVEYLDCIQFGEKLSNQYNNFVNPFYIFDILNEGGKRFFVNYYKEDILGIINFNNKKISFLEKQLNDFMSISSSIQAEVDWLNAFTITDNNQPNYHGK